MDLNNIIIPPAVLAELYENTLVATGDEAGKVADQAISPPVITTATHNESPWRSLGNNQKNILVVVSNPGMAYLPDNELSFLTGILSACKLSLADIALVNLDQYPTATYQQLGGFFKTKVALLFDIEPAAIGLPMNFPHYQLQPFSGSTFLYAPALRQLESDKVEKSKLWVCLKRLFNL